MLLDANLLLYAADSTSPSHAATSTWLEGALNGPRRIALPWQSIAAFLRIASNPRIYRQPLTGAQARQYVEDWLSCDPVWIPGTGRGTFAILSTLIDDDPGISGDLVPDATLAAIAIENGLTVYTTDSDFHRFPCSHANPLI